VVTYSPDGGIVEPHVPYTYDACNNDPALQPARYVALTNVNVVRGVYRVTDGTSSTVIVSELISDPDGSQGARGLWWYYLGNSYTHLRSPNTPIPDSIWGAVAYPYSSCDSTKSPCDGSAACWSTQVFSARSYHPGGVNALLCDGSVRFVKNSINLSTWQALASIGGGEVVSADAW